MPEVTIPDFVRRSIIDHFVVSGISWSGRLNDAEFLSRLYDLESLPSTDYRYSDAARDILQHRVYWQDWEVDWVFYDTRFNLLRAPDDKFLAFLVQSLHPLVRADEGEARDLASKLNDLLRETGWQLQEDARIAGRATYSAVRLEGRTPVFEEPTGWPKVDRQSQEIRRSLDVAANEEQFQAVGLLCREVMISLAQASYSPEVHGQVDDVAPSDTDAGRMLQALLATELRGSANEEARAYAKAALKLALALQHRRTADFRMAALCTEATSSVVNVIAILAGRRR